MRTVMVNDSAYKLLVDLADQMREELAPGESYTKDVLLAAAVDAAIGVAIVVADVAGMEDSRIPETLTDIAVRCGVVALRQPIDNPRK